LMVDYENSLDRGLQAAFWCLARVGIGWKILMSSSECTPAPVPCNVLSAITHRIYAVCEMIVLFPCKAEARPGCLARWRLSAPHHLDPGYSSSRPHQAHAPWPPQLQPQPQPQPSCASLTSLYVRSIFSIDRRFGSNGGKHDDLNAHLPTRPLNQRTASRSHLRCHIARLPQRDLHTQDLASCHDTNAPHRHVHACDQRYAG
jgi:hypothetical protein